MQDTKQIQISITTWPTTFIPVPKVEIWPVELEDGDLVFTADKDRLVEIELPEEFFLRELPDLELGQEEETILEFSRSFGQLGHPWLVDLPAFLQPYHPDAEYSRSLFPDLTELQDVRMWSWAVPDEPPERWNMKLGVFRLYAWVLRDIARIIYWHNNLLSFAEVVESWETPGEPPYTEMALVDFLVNVLNTGLSHFSVRVDAAVMDKSGTRPFMTWEPTSGPNLYQATCLQVANHLSERAVLLKCANETCNRYFYRQRGRVDKGRHHSSGVRYCSSSCARAQAQRELRRNHQKALNLHRSGLSVADIAGELSVSEDQAARWLKAALNRGKG